MRDRILRLIATQFNIDVDSLDENISFVDDLNADSIDIVELVMSIEEEFDIEIEDETLEKMSTIGDVLSYIEEVK